MYFKSLELFGFKSFAEKTLVRFEPGVTAIVGPNGCGKSNISDSIRWVLGEQSAKSLRGASMEDVIFNGSSAKEAVNFAEVSLTLSNESRLLPIDYDEVTITRRLYRSGDSEYLINRNQVRLKDIHEMLMGTGIGTDAYSIIEQGKMDVILNSKPEERREIFEEAAGITKFKFKKKEALRKLDQTDQNLLRVNDIIQEVKRQIGSIERQARKAESYKIEFEKMKRLELGLAAREFLGFENRLKSKSDELAELRAREEEYRSALDGVEERCREGKAELEAVEERMRELEHRELEAASALKRDQDRILLNRERIGELAERRENLTRQLETARRRIDEFRREYDRITSEFESIRHEETEGQLFLDSVETQFRGIEAAIQASVNEEESLKADIESLSERKSRIQGDLAKVNAELATLTARVRRLRQSEDDVRAEDEAAGIALRAAGDAVNSGQSALQAVSEERRAAVANAEAAASRLQTAEDEANTLFVKESALQSKLDFLKDLTSRHEGFLGGVKALFDAKKSGDASAEGMLGLLAELTRVEPGYERAAEAALESFLQAVVFHVDSDVMRAADYLRPLGKGRAVLISLEYTGIGGAAQDGGAEPVLSRLTASGEVESLLRKLVGNVFVAADPAQAFQLSKANPSNVYVTREGERFEGQVVMGGSFSTEADSAILGRDSRIGSIESELTEVRAALKEKEAVIERERAEEKKWESRAVALERAIAVAQDTLSEGRGKLRHAEDKKKHFEAELAQISAEAAELSTEQAKLSESEKGLNHDFFGLAEEEKRLSENVLNLRTLARAKSEEKETLLVRLAETRSRQEHFAQKREKAERDRAWAAESVTREEAQIAIQEKEAADALAKKESLETENEALEENLSRLSLERDDTLREAEGVRRRRQETLAKIESVETERDEKETFLIEAREKVHAYELEDSNLRHEIDRLKERIFNVYQIDLTVQSGIAETGENAAAALGLDAPIDEEAAREEVRVIREKLAKMGPVNLVAIEEFEEMRQRYEFLTQQHSDLIQAKEDLQKAIQKINRTTRELFVETFAQVQKNFTEYFRLLFGGGTAELVLLDEEDVLESGVDIIARPPGKKLQSISLLSGGEKALTAVALLFSLFKVKPSPFCILDELDAPLDETNVDRFCGALKEFIKESQFILITHNKRTMSLADAMYGITMAQTGVSRLVSVKFADKTFQNNGARAARREALVGETPLETN